MIKDRPPRSQILVRFGEAAKATAARHARLAAKIADLGRFQ
jgi:hypothetical protein